MPRKSKRPCAYPGCPELIEVGTSYCAKHAVVKQESYERDHRDRKKHKMYGGKWRKERAAYLREHPLCVECLKEGIYTEATEVDHIVPHDGNDKLFWRRSNWQPLCKGHHSAKTRRENAKRRW
jgi:5-methylcytosine-specific restriction protein A